MQRHTRVWAILSEENECISYCFTGAGINEFSMGTSCMGENEKNSKSEKRNNKNKKGYTVSYVYYIITSFNSASVATKRNFRENFELQFKYNFSGSLVECM